MTTTMNTITNTINELKEQYYNLANGIDTLNDIIKDTYAEVVACEISDCSDAEMEHAYNQHEYFTTLHAETVENAEALKKAIDKITEAYYIIRGI